MQYIPCARVCVITERKAMCRQHYIVYSYSRRRRRRHRDINLNLIGITGSGHTYWTVINRTCFCSFELLTLLFNFFFIFILSIYLFLSFCRSTPQARSVKIHFLRTYIASIFGFCSTCSRICVRQRDRVKFNVRGDIVRFNSAGISSLSLPVSLSYYFSLSLFLFSALKLIVLQ